MTEHTEASAAFHDLDAALAERAAEPVIVKFNETEYVLPDRLPASSMLAAMRMETGTVKDVEQIELNMRLVMTDEVFDALVKDGIAWEDLVALTAQLTRYYLGGVSGATEAEGDGASPSP